MKFYIGLFIIVLIAALAYSQDTGHGVCGLCVQVNKISSCCMGNTECTSNNGTEVCGVDGPIHDDENFTYKEFATNLDKREGKNFCTVCCGLTQEARRCCSGLSCKCMTSFYPSCYE